MRNRFLTPLVLASLISSSSFAAGPAPSAPPPPEMQQMMKTYTPELRQKAMALSPQLKGTIQKLHAGHTRRAKETTLRQVMHEILADYQAIASALATDNAEFAAEAARRLANHRIPKGGLLPYFALNQVNDADLGVLPAMNEAVEGSALRLAEAAEAGDIPKAASYLSDVMTGCVACHQKFRGTPGISANLISPVQK
jgi:Spy/CpxP family protein refolding chaperone